MSATATPSTPDRDVSLWWYLTVLLRRWRVIVLFPLAMTILTVTVALLTPRAYVATATFMPQERQSGASGLGALASQFGIALPSGGGSMMELYADLLKSKEILRAVALEHYELKTPTPFSGTLIEQMKMTRFSGEAAASHTADALKDLSTVSTNRFTNVVQLKIGTANAELSAKIARSFLTQLDAFDVRRRQQVAAAQRKFIEARMKENQASLNQAERDLADFHRRNRIVSMELKDEEAALARRVNLQEQMFLSLSQNLEVTRLEELRNTSAFTILAQPETFVEPVARGTVRKAGLTLVATLLIAIVLAFGLEAWPDSETSSTGYREFERQLGPVLSWLTRRRRA